MATAAILFSTACPGQGAVEGEGEGGGEDLIAPTIRWVHHSGTTVIDEELELPQSQLLAVCGAALITAEVHDGKPTGAVSVVTDVLGIPSDENLGPTFDADFWPWVPAVHTTAFLDDTPSVDCVLRLQQSSSILVVTNPESAPDVSLNVDDHFGFGTIATMNSDNDGRDEVLLSALNGDVYTVDWDGSVEVSTTRLMPEVSDKGYCLTAVGTANAGILAAGEVCFTRSTDDGVPDGPNRLFLLTPELEVTASIETALEDIWSLIVVDDQLYVVGRAFEPGRDRAGDVQTHVTTTDLSVPLAVFLEADLRAVADLNGDGSPELAVVRQVAITDLPAGTIEVRGHETEVMGPFLVDLNQDGRDDLIYGLVNRYSEY